VFGFSFGELLLLIIVAIILVGPRQLPSMLRTAGQWVAKLRRMAFDMRSQSGIDQLLRDEGLEKDIKELRRLLAIRRGNVLDALTVDIGAEVDGALGPAGKTKRAKGTTSRDDVVSLLTEFPLQGADAYGAVPEDVAPYLEASGEARVEQSDTRNAQPEDQPKAGVLAGTVAASDEPSAPEEAGPGTEQSTDPAGSSTLAQASPVDPDAGSDVESGEDQEHDRGTEVARMQRTE
jgi:sec-independent protein translocase protein TatB